VEFEEVRREYRYRPTDRVASPEASRSPYSRPDGISDDEGAARPPANRVAPRDLKRRLWFQKKRLERKAARGGGRGKGEKGRGKGKPPKRSPPPRR
jgi:hypothetical protein